jgi:hypothetical protein
VGITGMEDDGQDYRFPQTTRLLNHVTAQGTLIVQKSSPAYDRE